MTTVDEAAREGSSPAPPDAAESTAQTRAYAREDTSRPASVASGLTVCVVADCGRRRSSFDWCKKHYEAWRRHGDPLGAMHRRRSQQDDEAMFWSQVEIRGPSDCWPWTGKTSRGHGYLWFRGRHRPAHQVAWELSHKMPFPEGLQGDHLCHNEDLSCPGGDGCLHRRCENPEHIKPRSPGDNTRAARPLFRRRQDWREWLERQ